MFRGLAAAAAGAAIAMSATPASAAEIIYNSGLTLTAQGFGNAHRLITVQGKGQNTTESGCVSVGAGGTLVGGSGACISDAQVKDGNGFANSGDSEVNPLSDNQKFGIPTIGEVGWNQGADVALLFNAIEPGGDAVNVLDVTLKFYGPNGFITALDGQQLFDFSVPGNGKSDFAFTLDQDAQSYLNSLIFSQAGYRDFRIALETTISDAKGGPESWSAVNLGVPEPTTWAMMVLGIGLIGAAMRRQRSSVRLGWA